MALLGEKDTHLRAYFGYAGWSPGQLKNELKQNTWLVADAPRDLFNRPGDLTLWRMSLAREGDEWRLMAGEPEDPTRNEVWAARPRATGRAKGLKTCTAFAMPAG